MKHILLLLLLFISSVSIRADRMMDIMRNYNAKTMSVAEMDSVLEGDEAMRREGEESWSPTVRPPRLGGNKRMGVFATRSPFRPNPIGLTSVKLLRVEETSDNGLVLVVSGADLLDGTPIYDIKPYLAFSDSHPQAQSGFAEATQDYRLEVHIDDKLLAAVLQLGCPWQAIHEILSQDPRPAYQHDPERIYHLDYADWAIDFLVDNATVCIKNLSLL